MDQLIEAIKYNSSKVIDNFLLSGDINAPLKESGPESGYTALHFAVKYSNISLISKLLTSKTSEIHVNSAGKDGAQPLALACLLKNFQIANILLKNGADVDAELPWEVIKKYSDSKQTNFNKMTLLIYAVVNNKEKLCLFLTGFEPNYQIKDRNNKTLIMYAVENGNKEIVWSLLTLIESSEDFEIINARDDDNFHALHYLFLRNSKEKEKIKEIRDPEDQRQIFYALEDFVGADVNVMINDNPETLIINMAAKKSCFRILEQLLELEVCCKESRALFYAINSLDFEVMNERRRNCVKIILEDYTFRRNFGLFVVEEEKKLMDFLVGNNKKIQKIVEDYKEEILRNLEVRYNEEMTLGEFIEKVLGKKLKLMVKNKKNVEEFEKFSMEFQIKDLKMLKFVKGFVYLRIVDAWERRELIEKLEKISQLREAIPLPYEIVLEIIEWVDNESLEKFIKAFYQDQ